MILRITEVVPLDGGSAVRLRLTLVEGGHTEKRVFTLSDRQYFECGRPKEGEISSETFDLLESLSAKHEAVRTGAYLLGFAPANRAALRRKLTARGISPQNAGEAAEELAARGYLDEERQAERLILRYAARLYGRRRIEAELLHRGYPRETVASAFASCAGEIDFEQNRKTLLRKHFAGQDLRDPAVRRKAISLLHRYGY